MNRWIPIAERKPHKIRDTLETLGYYWVLVPDGDEPGRRHVMLWFGPCPKSATHWAEMQPFPPLPEDDNNQSSE